MSKISYLMINVPANTAGILLGGILVIIVMGYAQAFGGKENGKGNGKEIGYSWVYQLKASSKENGSSGAKGTGRGSVTFGICQDTSYLYIPDGAGFSWSVQILPYRGTRPCSSKANQTKTFFQIQKNLNHIPEKFHSFRYLSLLCVLPYVQQCTFTVHLSCAFRATVVIFTACHPTSQILGAKVRPQDRTSTGRTLLGWLPAYDT